MKKATCAIFAALLAAVSIPSTGMGIFNPTTVYVIDDSSTSWAESSGMGFGDAGGSGASVFLEKVVVTGKRLTNLEIVVVNSVTFTQVGNSFDPPPLRQFTFDARDVGVTVAEVNVPDPIDKAKCVANCGNIQTAENSLCDSRAASIMEATVFVSGIAKFGRYIPKYGTRIPKDKAGPIFDAGTKASITYAAVCKGEAAGRYNDCIHGQCQS